MIIGLGKQSDPPQVDLEHGLSIYMEKNPLTNLKLAVTEVSNGLDTNDDIDALISDLESDKDEAEDCVDDQVAHDKDLDTPEHLLLTSQESGLSSLEVQARRKTFGPNQLKDDKENLVVKFLYFFVGPIQFVMEVSWAKTCAFLSLSVGYGLTQRQLADPPRLLQSLLPDYKIG